MKRRQSGARPGGTKQKVQHHARHLYEVTFFTPDGVLLGPEHEAYAAKLAMFKERCPDLASRLEEGSLDVGLPPDSWQDRCYQILDGLIKQKRSIWFRQPVNPLKDGLPDYFNVIKNPMDLGTVKTRLLGGMYDEPAAFASAVRLTFNNAMLYNRAKTPVHEDAFKLLQQV